MPAKNGPTQSSTASETPILRGRVSRSTTLVSRPKVPETTSCTPSGKEFLSNTPFHAQQSLTFHPVLMFIEREMRKNAGSLLVQGLRELNETRSEFAWKVLIGPTDDLVVEWGSEAAFAIPALPASISRKFPLPDQKELTVTVGFRDWVRDYVGISAWDYKPDILKKGWKHGQPIDFSPIGKKETVSFYYDLWGNIHLGYVGRAAGFSADRLLWGGDVANRWTRGREDDSSDKAGITLGMELYATGTWTIFDLLRKLYARKTCFNKWTPEAGFQPGSC